jgi:Xaa-Pro aminopeptidase
MSEFERKQEILRELMARHNLQALVLTRVSSFAWATCGAASYVNTAVSLGESSLVITPSGRHLVTNTIEGPRLEREELLVEQGWEMHMAPWYENQNLVAELTAGLKVGADHALPGAVDLDLEMAHVRVNLMPEEHKRVRLLGSMMADAMNTAIKTVRPGQSEFEMAAILGAEAQRRGVQPIVNLIAADERIYNVRHPLPTSRKLKRYAMLIITGRYLGLVCSITRLVHFGHIPDELRTRAEAVAEVDAEFIGATRPGARVSEIFQRAQAVYARTNFPDEWQRHHQGGAAAYEPREYLATPTSAETVALGQVFAWNPSIAGSKSEDTILVGEENNEILTRIVGWPYYLIQVDGKEIARPAILEII